jgi:ketosteroid isomerase-like protein
MNKLCLGIALAVLALSGCKQDKAAAVDPGGETQPPAAKDAALAADRVDPREAAARALVDAWLAAQNGDDFDAYAALYAIDFRGVRRSGKKAVELDHAGWLADRRRMFAKPMQVEVADLELAADAGGVTVTFTQTWQSGSYADRGGKRLRLEARDGDLRIVAEEMLESVAAPTRDGCLAVLFPDEKPEPATIQGITALEPNAGQARAICLVHTLEDTSGEYVVALLGARGGRWVELDRETVHYTDYRTDDDEGRSSEEVTIAALAISPREHALRYEHERWEEGPQHRDSRTTTRLYRITGDELDELLSFDSRVSSGEADSAERVELAVADRQTRGFFDLELTTLRSRAEWAAGGDLEEDEPETTRYVWTGDGYQEK